jgi:hypothetical protein
VRTGVGLPPVQGHEQSAKDSETPTEENEPRAESSSSALETDYRQCTGCAKFRHITQFDVRIRDGHPLKRCKFCKVGLSSTQYSSGNSTFDQNGYNFVPPVPPFLPRSAESSEDEVHPNPVNGPPAENSSANIEIERRTCTRCLKPRPITEFARRTCDGEPFKWCTNCKVSNPLDWQLKCPFP